MVQTLSKKNVKLVLLLLFGLIQKAFGVPTHRVERELLVGHVFRFNIQEEFPTECNATTFKVQDFTNDDTDLPSWLQYSNNNTLIGIPDKARHHSFNIILFGAAFGSYVHLCQSIFFEITIKESLASLQNLLQSLTTKNKDNYCLGHGQFEILTIIVPMSEPSLGKLLGFGKYFSNDLKLAVNSLQIATSNSPVVLYKQLHSLNVVLSSILDQTETGDEYLFSWPIPCNGVTNLKNVTTFLLKHFHRTRRSVPNIQWHITRGAVRIRREIFFSSISAIMGTPVETTLTTSITAIMTSTRALVTSASLPMTYFRNESMRMTSNASILTITSTKPFNASMTISTQLLNTSSITPTNFSKTSAIKSTKLLDSSTSINRSDSVSVVKNMSVLTILSSGNNMLSSILPSSTSQRSVRKTTSSLPPSSSLVQSTASLQSSFATSLTEELHSTDTVLPSSTILQSGISTLETTESLQSSFATSGTEKLLSTDTVLSSPTILQSGISTLETTESLQSSFATSRTEELPSTDTILPSSTILQSGISTLETTESLQSSFATSGTEKLLSTDAVRLFSTIPKSGMSTLETSHLPPNSVTSKLNITTTIMQSTPSFTNSISTSTAKLLSLNSTLFPEPTISENMTNILSLLPVTMSPSVASPVNVNSTTSIQHTPNTSMVSTSLTKTSISSVYSIPIVTSPNTLPTIDLIPSSPMLSTLQNNLSTSSNLTLISITSTEIQTKTWSDLATRISTISSRTQMNSSSPLFTVTSSTMNYSSFDNRSIMFSSMMSEYPVINLSSATTTSNQTSTFSSGRIIVSPSIISSRNFSTEAPIFPTVTVIDSTSTMHHPSSFVSGMFSSIDPSKTLQFSIIEVTSLQVLSTRLATTSERLSGITTSFSPAQTTNVESISTVQPTSMTTLFKSSSAETTNLKSTSSVMQTVTTVQLASTLIQSTLTISTIKTTTSVISTTYTKSSVILKKTSRVLVESSTNNIRSSPMISSTQIMHTSTTFMEMPSTPVYPRTSSITAMLSFKSIHASSSQIFTPSPPNSPPSVTNLIETQFFGAGKFVEFQVPLNVFFDKEDGTTRNLRLTCYNQDDGALNITWLLFNSTTQTLHAFPLIMDYTNQVNQPEMVHLQAYDSGGQYTMTQFKVVITAPLAETSYYISMTLLIDFTRFISSKQQRFALISLMNSYLGVDTQNSSLYIANIKAGSTILEFNNLTLSTSGVCDKQAIQENTNLVKLPNTNEPKQTFKEHLSPQFIITNMELKYQSICTAGATQAPITTNNENTAYEYIIPIIILSIVLIIVIIIVVVVLRRQKRRQTFYVGNRRYEKGQPELFPDELELQGVPVKTKLEEETFQGAYAGPYDLDNDSLDQQDYVRRTGPSKAASITSDDDSSYYSFYRPPSESPPEYIAPPPYRSPFFNNKSSEI